MRCKRDTIQQKIGNSNEQYARIFHTHTLDFPQDEYLPVVKLVNMPN